MTLGKNKSVWPSLSPSLPTQQVIQRAFLPCAAEVDHKKSTTSKRPHGTISGGPAVHENEMKVWKSKDSAA